MTYANDKKHIMEDIEFLNQIDKGYVGITRPKIEKTKPTALEVLHDIQDKPWYQDNDHINGIDDGEPPGWYYETHRGEFDVN